MADNDPKPRDNNAVQRLRNKFRNLPMDKAKTMLEAHGHDREYLDGLTNQEIIALVKNAAAVQRAQ